MAIQGNKIMNLEDGQVLYNDLRRRIEKNAGVIEEVINTPSAVQTFDDGADELPMAFKVAVDPVQDLHGLDNPYPNGGGKNKLPLVFSDIKANNSGGVWNGNAFTGNGVTFTILTDESNNVTGVKVTGTADGDATIYLYGGTTSSSSDIAFSESFIGSTEVTGSSSTVRGIVWGTNGGYIDGSEVTFNAMTVYGFGVRVMNGYAIPSGGITFKPMLRIATDSSGFAPYSNICPIDGWTGAKVTRTGKNLYDMGKATQTVANVLYTRNSDGSYTATGTANAASVLKGQDMKLPVGSYKYSGLTTGNSNLNIGLYVNNSFVNHIATAENSFTLTKESIIRLDLYVANGHASNVTFYPMIRRASETDGTYEPYAGQEYSITFPSSAGTVYSGELTINKDGSGELVVDRLGVDIVYSDFVNTTSPFQANKANFPRPIVYNGQSILCDEAKSNIYKVYKNGAGSAYAHNNAVTIASASTLPDNTAIFWIKDDRITNTTELQSFLQNNPLKVVYPIATPVTYSLTPGQVKTLLGVNNLFADCGSILSVTYPADTKLYIDKKFAELSAAITALGT